MKLFNQIYTSRLALRAPTRNLASKRIQYNQRQDMLQLLPWASPMWKIIVLFFRFVDKILLQKGTETIEHAMVFPCYPFELICPKGFS